MKILLRIGISVWTVILLIALTPADCKSQAGVSAPEVILHLGGSIISGNNVKIEYEIPYDGYIEFYLYNSTGDRIWYTSSVKEKGRHALAINRTKMETNAVYLFEFWYKGKKYTGSFKNS